MKNIYLQALDLFSARNDLALATVLSAAGSTPQKAGSSAILGPEGIIAGTIGGGRIENEISQIVKNSCHTGYYSFELNNDISNKDNSICGGRMEILIDSNPYAFRSVFEAMADSLRKGPGTLITRIFRDPENVRVIREWSKAVPADPECRIRIENNALEFIEPVYPPSKLIIAGAGHIGKALSHIGNLLGFEITVIDDRPEFANKEILPDADRVIAGDISGFIGSIEKDPDTYLVIVTRGHSKDAEALRACIQSEAAYIGMIGSQRKIRLMKEMFMEEKWSTPQQWERIHAPIGLKIGSQTVYEIAVSIAAEIILIRNSKKENHG